MRSVCIADLISGLKSPNSRSTGKYELFSHLALLSKRDRKRLGNGGLLLLLLFSFPKALLSKRNDKQSMHSLPTLRRLPAIYKVLTLFVFIISPWSMRVFVRGNLLQKGAQITIVTINNKCCTSVITFFGVSQGLLKHLSEMSYCKINKRLN